jgi:hypothetical protein
MEPEGSLPHSQEPATCPYPEPYQPSPCPPSHFLKIHFNIILPSTPGSSKWSPSLTSPPPKSCTHLSPHPYVLHAPPTSFFLIFIFSPLLPTLDFPFQCRGLEFLLITLRDTPQSVGRPWTRDRIVAEAST